LSRFKEGGLAFSVDLLLTLTDDLDRPFLDGDAVDLFRIVAHGEFRTLLEGRYGCIPSLHGHPGDRLLIEEDMGMPEDLLEPDKDRPP